ncbi:methylenetetrahydrofolate reductase [NAD(P)H] [Kribbella jiaozuonensis]|uniref:Methylenetetrahydrofolate reductase n=1 Tax=Kribbella jiaozuonensis TaxID=2575441 RepID=A0A4V6XB66_9ACTN|nr:methylenetetrahydrofolate reductase [NAD(P)H] [Kribbella jiaozuonensis]TKK79553.1 methylenetetrahydrofolate reductase [NAD(P)H] [Kribbella jiaozuonensis]
MANGLPSTRPGGPPTIRELLASGDRSFSFEFFPPKTPEAEEVLWRSIREIEQLHPTFVSITYGAGGTTRDGTIRVTERVAQDTSLTPLGHLTCVSHSRDELRSVIGAYAGAGVRNMLALRGDPPGGPNQPWVAHPEGLNHAVELVELIRELGDFSVGVAAFPDKHPEATSLEADAQVLAAKAQAGADYAITQMFFGADDYFRLVDRSAALGCEMPVLPGIMPVTNIKQIQRMAELTGMALPDAVTSRLLAVEDEPTAVREVGIEIATELCERLLAGGAPGIHFITLNRSTATRQVFRNLSSTVVS